MDVEKVWKELKDRECHMLGSERVWPAALEKIRVKKEVVCEYLCRKRILGTSGEKKKKSHQKRN